VIGQPLLEALTRFERQISSEMTHGSLVELFCRQVIPFLRNDQTIEPLRKKWHRRYESLCAQVTTLEKTALDEVVGAFDRLKQELQPIDSLRQEIERIDDILAGTPKEAGFSSWPLYRHAFFEIKRLLESVLIEPDGLEICKRYALLGVKEKHIPRLNQPSEIVQEPYIMNYTFAPSIDKARLALDAAHWDQTNDPAVMWYYFLYAEWCWNTNESYFERTLDILDKGTNPFPALAEKATWLEIAVIRDGLSTEHGPVVFTAQLFREGFQTLLNDIMTFLVQDGQINDKVEPIDQVTLELCLNENRLWILAFLGLGEPKYFYIKRFNDGEATASTPFAFIEALLANYAGGGEVVLDFADKSENVPRALERMGMLAFFKHLFFGQSRGNKVVFYGSKISLPRDEKCRLLLEEFEKHHQQKGSPKYEHTDWGAINSPPNPQDS